MSQLEPSRTAARVATYRAAHQALDHPPVFVDPLASRIIGAAAAERAGTSPQGDFARYAALLRAFVSVRSRIAEDEVAAAVARGIRRYVILGAGLDTFAYRNPFSALRVIEVDQPATQAWKRAQLVEAGITPSINTSFVSVDFATEDLADTLRARELPAGTGAIFSWLGVTPYLERDVVLRTLKSIGGLAGPGGGVVFDYGVPVNDLDPVRRTAFNALMDRLAAIGEPWRTFFEPADLAAALGQCGFRRVKDWASDELNATYFTGRSDGLKVGSLGHIVVAHT